MRMLAASLIHHYNDMCSELGTNNTVVEAITKAALSAGWNLTKLRGLSNDIMKDFKRQLDVNMAGNSE